MCSPLDIGYTCAGNLQKLCNPGRFHCAQVLHKWVLWLPLSHQYKKYSISLMQSTQFFSKPVFCTAYSWMVIFIADSVSEKKKKKKKKHKQEEGEDSMDVSQLSTGKGQEYMPFCQHLFISEFSVTVHSLMWSHFSLKWFRRLEVPSVELYNCGAFFMQW